MHRIWNFAPVIFSLQALACSVILPVLGYPPHATRETPPEHIEEAAIHAQDPAPAVQLKTTRAAVDVATAAEPLAVFFFRGSWCPYCRGQLSDFNAHHDQLKSKGIRLIGVSADPPEEAPELVERLELKFELACDPELEAIKAFGVLDAENEIAWPALFVIQDGQVRYRSIEKHMSERKPVAEMLLEIERAVAPK